jgi:hypothetical protein
MSPSKRKFTASDLTPGQTYQVITAFKDYDGITHPVSENWRFVKKNFLPYEDGLTLYVERAGQDTSIRLQWRPESQAQIVDNFSDFVVEI